MGPSRGFRWRSRRGCAVNAASTGQGALLRHLHFPFLFVLPPSRHRHPTASSPLHHTYMHSCFPFLSLSSCCCARAGLTASFEVPCGAHGEKISQAFARLFLCSIAYNPASTQLYKTWPPNHHRLIETPNDKGAVFMQAIVECMPCMWRCESVWEDPKTRARTADEE